MVHLWGLRLHKTGFLFVRFRKNSRWKKLKHWKKLMGYRAQNSISWWFHTIFLKKTQVLPTISQKFCLKKWQILEFQAKNELQKCSIDCHHTFSRPYLEFSQKTQWLCHKNSRKWLKNSSSWWFWPLWLTGKPPKKIPAL